MDDKACHGILLFLLLEECLSTVAQPSCDETMKGLLLLFVVVVVVAAYVSTEVTYEYTSVFSYQG